MTQSNLDDGLNLNNGTATYTYDALSRMLTTTKGSEQRAYTYNGDGTLVAQTANSTTTHFTQDLVSPLSQILQTTQGTTTNSYVYGTERLYEQAGIVKTWYGSDGLGSVRQTLDDTGAPLSALNYDPWGTPEGGATPPVFGFAGEWQDTGVGLVNLRARWYAPGQGRFTARDPFAGFETRPYSLHPYHYAYSDPVSNTDPSGWCPLGPDGKPLPCRNPGPVPPSPVPLLPPVATGGSGDGSLCRLPGTPVELGAAAPALTALPIRPRPPLYVVPRQPVAPNPGPGILAWLGRLLPIVEALPFLTCSGPCPEEQPQGAPQPAPRGAPTPTPQSEPNWVVRAGVATAESLQRGSAEHRGVRGLYGFSVQYQPGKTVHELAAAGQFPHLQISVTTAEQLIAAASRAGYTARIVRSPGTGYHHTVEVPRPLPNDLAEALSAAFTTRMPNPAPVPRRR